MKERNKMNKKIRKIIEDEFAKKPHSYTLEDDDVLLEELIEGELVEETLIAEQDWWNIYRYVIKVGEHYIGYFDAKTTGDDSVRDMGYEINEDDIWEVTPIQKTMITYVKKEENNNVN